MSSPSLLAGVRLRQLRHYDKAEVELRRHLAGDPDDPEGHAELALCLLQDEKRLAEALESIGRAIGAAPSEGGYHTLRGWILCRMDRPDDALLSVDQAIRLDPADARAWAERARALHMQKKWKESAEAARSALAIDPDQAFAMNLLSSALQMQGDHVSGMGVAEAMLARDPDDALAHANLGWAKLRRQSPPKEAEAHFRESLRLSPGMEYARSGLIEAFKARSAPYRLFLRWNFWMARFSEGQQWAIFIGMFLGYRLGRAAMEHVHPLAVGAVVLLWMVFAFGSHLANGIGHALILLDRSARYCLTRGERWDGALTAALLVSGLALGVAGLSFAPPALALGGLLLVVAAIPAANVVLNTRVPGRLLFAAIVVLTVGAAIWQVVLGASGRGPARLDDLPWSVSLPLLVCALSTWLANLPMLVRRP